MEVSSARVLAWRHARQFLSTGARSVTDVVSRLGALPAWSGNPDLAVRRRLAEPSPTAFADAIARGDLIRTYAFRGATHLFAAEDAGVYLAVRAANRQWERRSWRDHYDLGPDDWPALREVVRDAVAAGPIRHSELIDQVTRVSRFRHLRAGLSDPSHTLLKPLGWQGDLCFGPVVDGRPTFQSPSASPRWKGIPDLEDAGPRAVVAYLAAYGPATRDNLHYWLVAGLSAGRRRLDGWIDDLCTDRVVEISVDGSPMFHLPEYVAPLAAADADPDTVTLLPGYDQWVLGPGTADQLIVPRAHRPAVTHGANLVLRAGRVAATWRLDGQALLVSWFDEADRPPRAAVVAEAERLAVLVGRDLTITPTES